MSAAAGPLPASRPVSAGRAASVVAGSLLALLALALVFAGGALIWAHATQRDDAGYYASPTERLATPTRALTAEGLNLVDVEGVAADLGKDTAGRVRIRAAAAADGAIFVGIAPEADVDRWLAGVAHDEVTDVHGGPGPERFGYDRVRRAGEQVPGRPADQDFWAASATGPGTRTVRWDVADGRWAVVVMNADGSPGVMADVSAGAKTGILLPVGLGLLLAGLIAAGLAASFILVGTWHGRGTPAVTAAGTGTVTTTGVVTAPARPYPVSVEARLDEPLSRWLWLVKWILAIPHWIALALLSAAFAVLTVVAWVAVLVTGRYPRGIFDFNVGVLRWSWRVHAYASGALSTDRYPPFTLGPADYPVDLEIPYPERLSRVRALVQPWLLAIPHLLIAGALNGAWNVTWTIGEASVAAPSVLVVLVLVAGFALLFTGRYPRDVFRLLVGINRWTYRAIAYAALLRDEFPPFRLED